MPLLPASTIIATNTSSISITSSLPRPRAPTASSACTSSNPVPMMALVELIRVALRQ